VVVAGHGQHAAQFVGAQHVGAMQRVAGAVDAGTLAVPHTENAIEFWSGEGVDLLRGRTASWRQVLVHAGLEADVVRVEQFLLAPQLAVQAAEGGASGIPTPMLRCGVRRRGRGGIAPAARGPCLDAAEEDRLIEIEEAALERGLGMGESDIHRHAFLGAAVVVAYRRVPASDYGKALGLLPVR